MPRPLFIPGKHPVPIVQEAGWAPGPVWTTGQEDSEYRSTALPFLTVIAYILPEQKKFYEEFCEIIDKWTLLSAEPGGPEV
jgi:hypothetical protein